MFGIDELLHEYDHAHAYTDRLWQDLPDEEVLWRPQPQFSAIGWHLGHQAHVAHFMVRNLTAAEPSPDPALDALMDSATPEIERGELPLLPRLAKYRAAVSERVHMRMNDIKDGKTGATSQLTIVAQHLLTTLINHEYQHDRWIGEVRTDHLRRTVPPPPESDNLAFIDGYYMLNPDQV